MASSGADAMESGASPGRLRVLFDAALELAHSHERDTLLRRIVEGAASVADARYAALGVYDDEGQLVTFVHHGFDDATIEAIGDYPEGRGLLGEVIVADRPVRLDNLSSHSSSCGFPSGHPPMDTFLGVPILRAGHRYGTLYLTEKAHGRIHCGGTSPWSSRLPPSPLERSKPPSSCPWTSVEPLRRSRLGRAGNCWDTSSRPRRPSAPGSAATCTTMSAKPSPRSCWACALWRTPLPALTSMPRARRRLADLRELVADGLRRTRQLAFDLRPTVLDDIGLVPALQRLTEDLTTRTGQTVDLDTAALHPDERLPTETETVIYRVVQEALTNVVRHAAASTASVTLNARDGRIRVFIEDDGVGFDPEHQQTRPHLGVEGMRQRAELVEGSLSITSTAGNGTVVLLEVARG